jgi:hypothetical protein
VNGGPLYLQIALQRLQDVRAFSSEVVSGSREEHALKQRSRAMVLIPSEPK